VPPRSAAPPAIAPAAARDPGNPDHTKRSESYYDIKGTIFNALIDAMRIKLEVKDFHAANQYYHMRNYQAAGVAFRNFNRQWPNSKYREDAMYFTLQSDYYLAMNSVEAKKLERLQEAIRSYLNFADAFPQSVLLEEAGKLHQTLEASLASAPTSNP